MGTGAPYFEETQWLRDTRWIWFIALAAGGSSVIPVLYIIFSQWFDGELVGDTPMSNLQLSLVLCALVAFVVVMITVIRMIRLSIIIDEVGIHYNFFPLTRGWRTIYKNQIVDYELLRKNNFFGYMGNGYSNNRITKTRRMRLKGNRNIRFQLADHWKIIIGTQRPEDFMSALKRVKNLDATSI